MKKNIVVNVSVLGETLSSKKETDSRISLLDGVAETIKSLSQDALVEFVLLPGGYFFSEHNIGELNHNERIKTLLKESFSKACINLAKDLEEQNPGIKIITGVDTASLKLGNKTYGGDQMIVAFNDKGIVGLGRKVFPVNEDVDGKKNPPMIVYENDFSSNSRVIELSSGKKAMLCSCYDMFGIATRFNEQSNKLSKIRVLKNKEGQFVTGRNLQLTKKSCFNSWKNLFDENKVSIGISAIHRFNKPGRDIFWQRHGIASASAALNGNLAIGAAHYKEELPEQLNNISLASKDVPIDHLSLGSFRKANHLKPLTLKTIQSKTDPQLKAVLRTYSI